MKYPNTHAARGRRRRALTPLVAVVGGLCWTLGLAIGFTACLFGDGGESSEVALRFLAVCAGVGVVAILGGSLRVVFHVAAAGKPVPLPVRLGEPRQRVARTRQPVPSDCNLQGLQDGKEGKT